MLRVGVVGGWRGQKVERSWGVQQLRSPRTRAARGGDDQQHHTLLRG